MKIDLKILRGLLVIIQSNSSVEFIIELWAPGYKISHAGIANTETDLYNEDNYDYAILWTRKELKNFGKPQIIGHTPHELQTPLINTVSNSYNIDSGCCYSRWLTGIVMNDNGELLETFFEKVDVRVIS